MAEPVRVVAHLAPGVSWQVVGDDVLAFDGKSLHLLTGTEARSVTTADGVRPVLDLQVAEDLAAKGILTLESPPAGDRFRCPDDVGVCEDGDHLVLLDLRTGYQHVLSASGAEIWQLVTETGSLEKTIAELEHAHVDATSVAPDAAAFVAELVAADLLERLTQGELS